MFAAGFRSTSEKVHSARAKLVAGNQEAIDFVDTVTLQGFKSSILAQNGVFADKLRGLADVSHYAQAR